MAKNFMIDERPAPTGCLAAPVSGGNLTAGVTYFYRIVACGSKNYYYDNHWLSVPSSQFSAATVAGKTSAQIYFDNNVAGAVSWYVYRTRTAWTYAQTDGTGAWQKHLVPVTGADTALGYAIKDDNANLFKVYTFTTTAPVASLVPGETITGTGGVTAIVVSNPNNTNTFKVRSITGTWTGAGPFSGSITGVTTGVWSSTSAQVGWCLIDTIADSSCLSAPIFENGLPTVWYDGGTLADPITPQDVYTWLISQGRDYYCYASPVFDWGDWLNSSGVDICQYFSWRFNLMQKVGLAAYFKIHGGVVVYHLFGKWYTDSGGGGQVDIGETVGTNTRNGGVYIANKPYAVYSGLTVNTNIYASFVGGGFNAYANNSICKENAMFQMAAGKVFKLYDSVYTSKGRQNANYDIKRSRYGTGGNIELVTGDLGGSVIDTYLSPYYPVKETFIKNAVMSENASWDANLGSSYYGTTTAILHLINCKWRDSWSGRIQGYNSIAASDMIVTDELELTFRIVDTQGNSIPYATVRLNEYSTGRSALIRPTGVMTAGGVNKDKNNTTLTFSGYLSPGSVYRLGLEHIKIVDGTAHPNYTVIRGHNGTTKNYIPGYNTENRLTVHSITDSEQADYSGIVSGIRVLRRFWAYYDMPLTTYYDMSSRQNFCNDYLLRVDAPGYKPFTARKSFDVTATDMTITLEPVFSNNQHTSTGVR